MPNKMILIMGLPGSGKTTFAEKLKNAFEERGVIPSWFNADKIREAFDDWDFSEEGRLRQAKRMRRLVDDSQYPYCIVDMVAPTRKTRTLLKPDYLIFMNTIGEGRFEDTNKLFDAPGANEINLMIPKWEVTDQVAQDIANAWFPQNEVK
jgi:adenylylsulfate kinase